MAIAMDDANYFFVHPSDNLGLMLFFKKTMKIALLDKNKFGFIDGSIVKPALGHANHIVWHRNDNIVASSWLLKSLSKEMQVSVLHCYFAKAIWDYLKERFMSVYVWESLLKLKFEHTCTCTRIKPWCEYAQLEYVMYFSLGLNEAYSWIRGQILYMDHFPYITEIFSMVVQEEKHKEIGTTFATPHAFVMNGYPPNHKMNKSFSIATNHSNSGSMNQVSMGLSSGAKQNENDSNGMILYATSSFNLFKDVWLIDSGVGTHVACFLKNLESYQTIPNKTITLPNRTVVPVVVVGIVRISPTLLLHNVLLAVDGSTSSNINLMEQWTNTKLD
ncbi:hypothetical protein JHK87_007810 [Glycine soja]|nr:hypothetical protein JHK87_007810 [Glycine soja]